MQSHTLYIILDVQDTGYKDFLCFVILLFNYITVRDIKKLLVCSGEGAKYNILYYSRYCVTQNAALAAVANLFTTSIC